MNLQALIEPLEGRAGYRARVGAPIDLAAEGDSPEAALRGLAEAIQHRLAGGARLVTIQLPGGQTLPAPGWLPDDDLTREWRQNVEDYRRERDVEEKGRILGEPEDGKEAS